MKPALQKALGWIGLAIGGGGTLLLAWVFIIEDCPADAARLLVWWLAGSALLTGANFWVLKRAYRLEPVPGRIQLALADLISALLVLGSVLYIGSYAEEGTTLLAYWLMPALVLACSYLVGITQAARLGLRTWRRYAVGTATALTIIGCLGVGALTVNMLLLAGRGQSDYFVAVIWRILGLEYYPVHNYFIYAYRLSLPALPLGLLLGLALRLTMRSGFGASNGTIGKPNENP